MLIAGDRDIEAAQVSVRLRTGGAVGGQSVEQFLTSVMPIVESRDPVDLGFSA